MTAQILDFSAALARRVVPAPAPAMVETKRVAVSDRAHFKGSKHVHHRDLAEVAKDIRKDIAEAIRRGLLPAGLKTSVGIRRYSMGQSLDVRVTAVPGGFVIPNVARVRHDVGPNGNSFTAIPFLSAQARALVADLEELASDYNHVRDDRNAEFYLSVAFESGIESAQRKAVRATVGWVSKNIELPTPEPA